MPSYRVTITASITKTYYVSAPDDDKAVELAHQLFTVTPDGRPEEYAEETNDWAQIPDGDPVDGEWEDDA